MIHPSDEEALQTIDAAVFSGDPEIIRERLTYFMERWQKALDRKDDRGSDSRPQKGEQVANMSEDNTQVLEPAAEEVVGFTEEIRESRFIQMNEAEKENLFYSALRGYGYERRTGRNRRKG
ncbi:hypothetical protein LCGC14_0243750 [marine sediment metagenome]|uniref:Uncharacterized protein n=1 Tax=marine sediment metagenome TaxID=412755 RepID=A0A0F9XAZ0_9ZZZZ